MSESQEIKPGYWTNFFRGIKRAFVTYPESFMIALITSFFISVSVESSASKLLLLIAPMITYFIIFLGLRHNNFKRFKSSMILQGLCWVTVIGSLIFIYTKYPAYRDYPFSHLISWVMASFSALGFCLYFYGKGKSDRDVFLSKIFNHAVWDLIFAMVFAGFAFASISIAYFLMDNLFQIRIDEEVYVHTAVWLFGVGAIWKWLADFSESNVFMAQSENDKVGSTLQDKILCSFAQYVAIPLSAGYLLFVYAFALKHLISMSWPQGQVGWLACSCIALCTLSWLMIRPYLDVSKVGQFFLRFLPIFMLPVAGILSLAAYKRITTYGLTESRYALILICIWVICILLSRVFARFRQQPLRITTGIAASLLLIGAFGPLSSESLSYKSQHKRLINHLNEISEQKSSLFKDIDELRTKSDLSDKYNFGANIRYLKKHFQGPRLASVFQPYVTKTLSEKDLQKLAHFFVSLQRIYLSGPLSISTQEVAKVDFPKKTIRIIAVDWWRTSSKSGNITVSFDDELETVLTLDLGEEQITLDLLNTVKIQGEKIGSNSFWDKQKTKGSTNYIQISEIVQTSGVTYLSIEKLEAEKLGGGKVKINRIKGLLFVTGNP